LRTSTTVATYSGPWQASAAVQNVLHKIVIYLVRDDLKAMVERIDSHTTATDAVVEFIAGGLFGLLMWWLGGKTRLSVEELNALFRRFAIPVAKATLRARQNNSRLQRNSLIEVSVWTE
jgi:hypothetical protein